MLGQSLNTRSSSNLLISCVASPRLLKGDCAYASSPSVSHLPRTQKSIRPPYFLYHRSSSSLKLETLAGCRGVRVEVAVRLGIRSENPVEGRSRILSRSLGNDCRRQPLCLYNHQQMTPECSPTLRSSRLVYGLPANSPTLARGRPLSASSSSSSAWVFLALRPLGLSSFSSLTLTRRDASYEILLSHRTLDRMSVDM